MCLQASSIRITWYRCEKCRCWYSNLQRLLKYLRVRPKYLHFNKLTGDSFLPNFNWKHQGKIICQSHASVVSSPCVPNSVFFPLCQYLLFLLQFQDTDGQNFENITVCINSVKYIIQPHEQVLLIKAYNKVLRKWSYMVHVFI